VNDSIDQHASKQQTNADRASQFVSLIVQHRHSLYAFVAKQLVHPADAEDVFQRTSLVLWSKMETFDFGGSFFHWACGIAFNEVRNHRRTQARGRLHFDTELSELLAEESIAEAELTQARLEALDNCLEKLSSRQQQIIRRCYEGTATISEVASTLGRSRDGLYKQLARLREKLADCIRGQLAAEDFES
jgi:RNA polymerase sigma-70 factor (ECF subfamily)